MSTIEEIVQAIKELPPHKWDEVKRRLVRLWLSSDRPDLAKEIEITEDSSARNVQRYHGHAYATLPRKRSQPRRPPIKIKGKPISETVVEDRR